MALITELDDRTLVEQHRAGDEDAFRQIVVRHHRSMYANALRRLGDPALAEDAVQEAFLRAFRNLERFEGQYHLDAWLHRIVTNTCHDLGRRRGRDTRLFDRACTEVEVDAPAADDALEVLPDPEVSAALERLPATYREVLLLRFVEELSYSDVAVKAGISEENARARVSRGRTMLKKMLSSTSALVVWAVPPLRRFQTQAADPDATTQAAGHIANVATAAAPSVHATPGLNQITNLVAQAGPAIATATPAASSSAPALKAAVAAGLAAAVAIPTGVAVDRAREKPPRQPVAPLVVEQSEAAAPAAPVEVAAKPKPRQGGVTDTTTSVGSLSTGTSVIAGGVTSPAEGDTARTDGSTTTEAPAPTTSVPPATDGSTTPTTAPPTTAPPAQEEPPRPAPAPARFAAEGLTVTEKGPRFELDGRFRLEVGDQTHAGHLSGRIAVGDGDPKDPKAPRPIDLTKLVLTLDHGQTFELLFSGTAVVSEQGGARTLDLTLAFRLDGGSALGVAESGDDLTGRLQVRGSSGSLTLAIPAARP